MNIICVTAANAMQGERIERKGDIPICDIPIYRETERLGNREIGSPRDRETRKPRDWEQKSAGGWKVNNRVSIANAP